MKLWLILILGLGLRLINLDQSLWLDEAVSAGVVRQYNLSQIVNDFSPGDFHPPAYYIFLKLWTNVFGTSEAGLRLLSVVVGVATIYIVYKIAGKAGAMLAAVNPLLIYYSQEARQYSLVTLFLTICVYYWLKLIKKFSKKDIFLFNLFSALSFVTFYGSAFLLVTMAAYFFLKKKYKLLVLSNLGWLLAIVGLKDLIVVQLANSRQQLLEVKNWSLVLGKLNLKNLVLIPIKFSVGRISFYPKKLYYVLAGLWTGIVFLNLKKNKIYKILLVGPLLIAMFFSLHSPLISYFRFLYLVPIMVLLIKERKILIFGFLGWSLLYLLIPKFHREDWKSLAWDLDKKEVYIIESVSDPIKYYRSCVTIKDLKGKIEGEEILVVPYAAEIHGLDYEKKLKSLGYKKGQEQSYREIGVEEWYK